MSNAESQAQSMGGTQGSAGDSPTDADRAQIANEESRGSGDILQRATGDDRAQSFRFGLYFGGILSQLMSDAENRLAEARECVDWYQREVGKCEERLQQLRALNATLQEETEE